MPLTLEDIYAMVPKLDCRGHCAPLCRNQQLRVANIEARRANAVGVKVDDSSIVFALDPKGRCHKFRNGWCTVHADKPLVCRLWGATEDMVCDWGCVPERVLPVLEARMLSYAVALMQMNEDEGIPAPNWIRCLKCGLEQPDHPTGEPHPRPCVRCKVLYAESADVNRDAL